MDRKPDILKEIETFMDTQAMTASAFGRAAMGDPKFVFQLRDGRRLWPETAKVARDFMRSFKRKPARRREAREAA